MNSPATRKTSGLAITSFILGLLGFCCPIFLSSLAAVICGHIARGKIKKDEASLGGGGLAMTGLILGYLSIVFWIVAAILASTVGGKFVQASMEMLEAKQIHSAVVQMVSDGASKGDKSLGWPADAGITTVTELKRRLVDNGYLTDTSINFEKFEFGNVSESDPGETIFIKLRTQPMAGLTLFLGKDGEQGESGDDTDAPPRTPPYLAP